MHSKIVKDIKYDFNNVLILPKRSTLSSRKDVILDQTFTFKYSHHTWNGISIIASNMDTTGTFEIYDVLSKYKCITCMNKFYTCDDYQNAIMTRKKEGGLNPDYFMVSTGISTNDYENVCSILDTIECKWICVDVANGYMTALLNFLKRLRHKYPNHIIVAGNVATVEGITMISKFADVVKLGIGSGSACLTRQKTGVGYPQLSCILDCKAVSKITGVHIISDGGVTNPADMAKAFGAGADFVMCGGVFAGHDENPGELIDDGGNLFKLFYGMSSKYAMKKYYSGMSSYKTSEGRTVKVPYKGKIEETLLDYLGGIRSCCTYTNSKRLSELEQNTQFIAVTQQLNTTFE